MTGDIRCDALFPGGHACSCSLQYRYTESAEAWDRKLAELKRCGWAFWVNSKGDSMRYLCPDHTSITPIHAKERKMKRVF